MNTPASMVVARILAGFFFWISAVSACDGEQPTCPATQENQNKWRHGSFQGYYGSIATSDYVYSSGEQAGDAFCSRLRAIADDPSPDACTGGGYASLNYNISNCRANLTSATSGNISWQFSYTTNSCNSTSTSDTHTTTNGYVGADLVPVYVCNNAQYPVGPDTNNVCHMSGCKSGKRHNSSLNCTGDTPDTCSGTAISGPDAPGGYCALVNHPSGTQESCMFIPSPFGICTTSSCQYDYAIETGETCSGEHAGEKSPTAPCTTYGDGHQACDSDSSPSQTDSSPGNNGTGSRCITMGGRQYCIDVTPPSDNCASNPDLPQCVTPVDQNCTFVGGKYYCSDSDNSCGTFNGVSLCICEDGTVEQSSELCSGLPEGTGPGEVGDGVGGDGGGEGSGDGISKQVDDEFPGLTKPQRIEGLDEFQGRLGEKPQTTISGIPTGLEPFSFSTGCGALQIPNPIGASFSLQPPCEWMEVARAFFGVVFVVYTIGRCRRRILESI